MDYGYVYDGRVFTPNGTSDIDAATNAARNKAIEAKELELWDAGPDRFLTYYNEESKQVTTWLGSPLGDITAFHVYRHSFGGRFVSIRVQGSNHAIYHGRASYDGGNCINLRRSKQVR